MDEEKNIINITYLITEGIARIMMSGTLDFDSRKVFKKTTSKLLSDEKVREIVVEMGQVTHIGTSGMGMLYLLQERANENKKELTIAHPVGKVREWLLIANTDEIFTLDTVV